MRDDATALLAAYDAGTELNQAGAAGPSMAGTTLAGIPLQAAPNTGAADGNGLVRLLVSPVWTYPSVKMRSSATSDTGWSRRRKRLRPG